MKPFSALTAAVLIAATSCSFASQAAAQDVAAPSGVYQLDPTHASVVWKVKHLGLSNYVGRLNSFTIDLTLDVEDPTKSAVSAVLDTTSIDTPYPGEKDFNAEVSADARFLNSGEHPQITFNSKSIEMTGDATAKITGDLTMLGVTNEVVLDATLVGSIAQHPFGKKPAIGFSATTTLDRTAFGMNFLAPVIVSPEVIVEIDAEFVKAD